MKNIITILLLATSTAAFARLGESNVEILKRYGPVEKRIETGTNSWSASYSFKEYKVFVLFRDNKSECEYIQPMQARKFTDPERDALMNGIAGSDQWIQDDTGFSIREKMWTNKKTQAVALVKDSILEPSMLVVSSHECTIRIEAEQKAKEKAKANGF